MTLSGPPHRPGVVVSLLDHYAARVYTSGAAIAGTVTISTPRDVPFDCVQILLLGVARTRCDAMQVSRDANRVFLRVAMPVRANQYPAPRVLEGGREYSFPFRFVVPHQLTIDSCQHAAAGDNVGAEHVRLPPSMGTWGKWHRDDMAPEMARIEYAVKAVVLATATAATAADHGSRSVRLMAGSLPVNVLPASGEAPPLSLCAADRLYMPAKTKTVRKGLLAGKTGRLTASAAQPPAVFVSPDGRSASSSRILIDLCFQPAIPGAAPPKINGVAAKLTTMTYFNTEPVAHLPNLGTATADFGAPSRLNFRTTVALFSVESDAVSWCTRHAEGREPDRSFGKGSIEKGSNEKGSIGKSSSSSNNGSLIAEGRHPPEHVATLAIPFELPTAKKLFLPTFHSCLVSRIYVLRLNILAGPTTSFSLSLPLQVAVEGPVPGPDGLHSAGGETAEAKTMWREEDDESDEYLRPGVRGVVDEKLVSGSEGMPPEYEEGSWNGRR